jgi:ribosome-associated translation inhibitor RaiA
MNWELHAHGVEVDNGLREHIERRLTFALSRFGSRITKAVVSLTDTNGPKGGVDKCCRIVLRLRSMGDLVAEVTDTEWPVTVDRATARIGHNVSRGLERKRDFARVPISDQ